MSVLIASSPPLGWNSWDSYGFHLDEDAAVANLERFADWLQPAGYEYFVVDMGWCGEYDLVPGTDLATVERPVAFHLDEYGRYLPSRTYFPRGFTPLAERCHAAGVRFGVHIMRGVPRVAVERRLPVEGTTWTAADIADVSDVCDWCDWNYGIDVRRPGAQEYYDGWVALLASWGVDFIKADDITAHPAEIDALALAIERSGRPMMLSLSPGSGTDLEHLASYERASMVRTTLDIWDDRTGLERAFTAWREWQDVKAGVWPDLDMLCLGALRVKAGVDPRQDPAMVDNMRGPSRDSRLSAAEQRSFLAMRALAASPLFMGGDLPTTDQRTLDLILNPGLLACNQNGVVGTLRFEAGKVEAWATPRRDNASSGWLGVFNRGAEARVAVPVPELRLGDGTAVELRDVWTGASLGRLGADDAITAALAPGDVLFAAYDVVGGAR